MTYPLDIEFIPEFEKLNNLKINAFELIKEQEEEEENIKYATKILYSSYEKYKNVVSLLLFEKDDKQHYVWIKDINKLDKSSKRAGWRSFRGKRPDEAKERDSRMIEETSA